MNKKLLVISLAVIAVLGSLVTFYASNLFFSDVSNFGAGFMNTTLFVTLPMLLCGAMFAAAPICLVRLFKRPENKKALSKLYLIIAMALAGAGILFAILGGVVNMGSFIKPYPFPGYLIIMLVLHLIVLGGALFAFFKFVKPMPEDAEKYKGGVKHIFHTLGLYLLIALAFNRFGAFLLMPVYCQFSTLYKTFVYYLFLLIPMFILIIKMLRVLDMCKCRFILSIVALALTVVLFGLTAFLGMNDSSFISAVSAAAPLERLGSMPMEILIHVVTYIGVLVYYIIIERPKKA